MNSTTLKFAFLGMALSFVGVACGDDNNGSENELGGNLEGTPVLEGRLVGDGPGGAPDASGGVTVQRRMNGSLVVVLGSDFSQEMGPGDTQLLFATSAANINTQRTGAASSVSEVLGVVPNGFSGAATFDVPSSVNPSDFAYLIVWCPTAGVNFGMAMLTAPALVETQRGTLVGDGSGGAPDATGTVTVERDRSGALFLVLGSDFSQETGPGDTQVYLARGSGNINTQRSADPTRVSMVLGTVPNGASGARQFAIPAAVQVDDFDHVIVWCPTAGVNFGAAALSRRTGTLQGDGVGGAPDATGSVAFGRDNTQQLTIELGADFMQELGPGDTQLFLTQASGSLSDLPTSAVVLVGTLTNGASGAQTLVVPAGTGVDAYDHVIVWCPTAGVNFGVAALQ